MNLEVHAIASPPVLAKLFHLCQERLGAMLKPRFEVNEVGLPQHRGYHPLSCSIQLGFLGLKICDPYERARRI
jgi:hypothetical protein